MLDFLRTISKGYQGQIRNILLKFMAPSYTTTELTTLPNLQAGMIVYDSTINKLKMYNGTAFETIASV